MIKVLKSLSNAIVEAARTVEDTVNLAHAEVQLLSKQQDQRITKEKTKLAKLKAKS